MKKAVVAAALVAAVVAPPAGAAGAVWAIHDMERHMYFRDTPTGRQADFWRDQNLREQINDAIRCERTVGDPDCDGEG